MKSPQLIERLDDERVLLPLAWLYDWRQQLQEAFNTHFAPETAGVLNAAVLGNHHFLSKSASERFREGGTFHVLVISGLHISFIGGVFLHIARKVYAAKIDAVCDVGNCAVELCHSRGRRGIGSAGSIDVYVGGVWTSRSSSRGFTERARSGGTRLVNLASSRSF